MKLDRFLACCAILSVTPKLVEACATPDTCGSAAPMKQVDISAFRFRPEELVVPTGTQVRWLNLDAADHTATAQDNPPTFDSGNLLLNDSYSFQFNAIKFVPYHCAVHTDMLAFVDVRLLGDANGDRRADIGDFALLAANFNAPGDYTRGDFDLTGQVDIGDFALLAANFNLTAARAHVPEPGSLGGLLLVALGVSERRPKRGRMEQ